MHTIAVPAEKKSKLIREQAWVISSSKQKTGSGLCTFHYRLFISGKEYDAFLWCQDDDSHWPEQDGTRIIVSGEWTVQNWASTIRIKRIAKTAENFPMIVAENIYQSPRSQLSDQLIQFIGGLQIPLKLFLCELFTDTSIATAFVKLPASLDHHHAYAGGLLEHSIECALMCGQLGLPWLNKTEAEVTMVAALLHDIGKIRTHQLDNKFTHTGHCVPHDTLTLEVLGPALNLLQNNCATTANLLRHILTWDHSQSVHPAFPGTLMVKMADRLSTGLDRRNDDFSDHPDWHYQARSGSRQQEKYLRIPA